jgi:hypothetical protein
LVQKPLVRPRMWREDISAEFLETGLWGCDMIQNRSHQWCWMSRFNTSLQKVLSTY